MIFSFAWLRELCPVTTDAAGTAELLTSRGLTVDGVESIEGDETIEVDVPANRPDCLGHLGLARELSAATGTPLRAIDALPECAGESAASQISVRIADGQSAARYTAALVREVRVGPSPAAIVQRLESCGLRSVNNIVDISNLVMLETGQPVHFFDFDLLPGAADGNVAIEVRHARAGEQLTTLDGVEHKLDSSALLIASGEHGLALAGVIGGAETEIRDSTRNVLIEAAHFDGPTVRKTARALGVLTDASFRFERGSDAVAGPENAQRLAAQLLAKLAGGTPAPGIVDEFPSPPAVRRLLLRLDQVERLLGYRPQPTETESALKAIGFSPVRQGEAWNVTLPSWRADLQREADLVEEIARHLGYDRIPVSGHNAGNPQVLTQVAGEDSVREWLAHHGFHEAMAYSMIAEDEDLPFIPADSTPALTLVNPIAQPLAKMRRSILPGLLRAAELNQRRGAADVRLFEVGRVFHSQQSELLPREELRAAVVWSGAGEAHHWSRSARPVDLSDLIGLGESLIASQSSVDCRRVPGAFDAFHPGRSCRWMHEDRAVAWGGSLHPDLRPRFEHDLFMIELILDGLPPATGIRQQTIARVPAVQRDLSLLIEQGTAYAELIRTVAAVKAPAPLRCEAIDRYQGPPLQPGQTSMTIRIHLDPHETTLTDSETDTFIQAVVSRLESELGVLIRS